MTSGICAGDTDADRSPSMKETKASWPECTKWGVTDVGNPLGEASANLTRTCDRARDGTADGELDSVAVSWASDDDVATGGERYFSADGVG